MRFIAPIAALALAGAAWIACWQEVQLVRLKRQVRPDVAAATTAPQAEAAPKASRPPVQTGGASLDRLRTLLIERQEAIADARDAAADFGIAEGSPDLDRAILLATQDLDRAIIKLAGPAAASQLTMTAPRAALPAEVAVAPAPVFAPAPAVAPIPVTPAPSYTIAPATNIYINVAVPAPVYPEPAPAPALDPALAAYAAPPIIYGGLGASFGGRASREDGRRMSQSEKLKYFAASAGIPLSGSPLGATATTSPLLLSRQRSASAAGR